MAMAARYPRCAVLMWLHGVVRRRYVAAMVRREEESGRVCAPIVQSKVAYVSLVTVVLTRC